MNASHIIRILTFCWDEQRVECMVRDGNVIRRVWLNLRDVYINQMEAKWETLT